MLKKSQLIPDFSASIVVFLVALPLCLGIALGSGAPLSSGIISGIIGGIIVGFLSGSPLSVSGPAAGLIAIVLIAIQTLGSFEAFLLSVILAGLIQFIFGVLRFGNLGDFVPSSVIKGMLAAIGLILIMKQIPHFFGYDSSPLIAENSMQMSDQNNVFITLTQVFDNISQGAAIIGLFSVAVLIFFEFTFIKKRKILKMVPAPLIAVASGVFINELFLAYYPNLALYQEHLVNLDINFSQEGAIKNFLIFPSFQHISNGQTWFTAVTIAIVASIETLLCTEAVDRIDKLKRRTSGNRELKAQGIGNILAGFIGGLPITSVIVRSSANVDAGAKTKLSAILHGVWLLLSIALIPGLLNKIPYSSLAAILIITGFKLTNPKIFKDLYKNGHDQIIPFAITIFAILATNLLYGIAIGIFASIVFILRNSFKSSIILVQEKDYYLLRFRKDVSFFNKSNVKLTLENLPPKSRILIDVTKSDFIDKDVIEVINDFRKHAHLKKIRIEVKKNNYNKLHKLIK